MSPKNATEIGQRRHYLWNGERYPSVTTRLKAYPKEWLGAWAAKQVAEYAVTVPNLTDRYAAHPDATLRELKGAPWRRRDDAAGRGTAVHEAAEREDAEADVPEHARPAYRSYLGWLDLYKPHIRVREGQVWNLAERYAGSFDLICDLYGKTYLVDIKTGTTGADVRLQLAAYIHAEFVGSDDVVDEKASRALWDVDAAAVLKLTDEGFQFLEIEAGLPEFRVFRNVCRVYDYWNAYDKEGVGGTLILPQTEVS